MRNDNMNDWYKINGQWYHCVSLEGGKRYVDGKLQED